MLHHFRIVSALSLLCVSGGLASEPKEAAPANVMAIHLHNGTIVKQATIEGSVELETRYGKFVIPAGDIRRIDFGFRVPDEESKKLEQALHHLRKGDFPQRESASKELIGLGRLAYPALLKAAKGADLETIRRVELVLDEIRKKVHHEQLKIVEEDTVHTADAVLRGKITAPVLKARAKVLGELQVPLGHLHRLRSMSGCQLVSLVPSTDEPWVQTDLQLVPGSQFEIKASGTIYFEIKGLKRNAAPRGNEELRNIIDSMVGHSVGFAPGLVRGRIGTDGETFEIGKSYQGTASQEGRLYLQIYTGGPHEIPLSGSYQVEIEGY